MADLATLQVRRDRALRDKLSADGGVKRALAKIEERTSGFGFAGRRRLLAGALRLTRSMAPDVAGALADARAASGVTQPIEVFVKPEATFNAFCLRNPNGLINVGLSAGLLEAFSPPELRFVLGHELAHAAYEHFALPMPLTAIIEDFAGTMVSRPTAIELFVWCRAAEISCDRVGLIACRDPDAAANAFFKLASGLRRNAAPADLEAYASQVESLASAPSARRKPRDDDDTIDAFSTHPYCPARVRALVGFARSRPYREAVGEGPGGLALDEVEAVVEHDLAIMEPTYLEEKTPRSDLMRRLLFSAGVSVAASDEKVAPSELEALRALLGAEAVSGPLDVASVRRDLEGRIDQALAEVPPVERAQVVQHLTIVAAADGVVQPAELEEMHRIAGRLGIDPAVIEQTLAASAAPMD